MKYITLTSGHKAIVDDADFERLSNLKWYGSTWSRSNTVYARATKHPVAFMHWLVIGRPPKGMHTDHINGNGLDNRAANLRHVSPADNVRNQRKAQKGSVSKFLNVYLDKRRGHWRAQIRVNGRKILNKAFATELEAARSVAGLREQLGLPMCEHYRRVGVTGQ